MTPTLHIYLLGDFRLIYGKERITGVKTVRLQSLLAYLVLHRVIPQPRQRIAFLFWPDTSEEQARNNLRNLLHFLRRALPDFEHFLLVDTQTIQWNPQSSFTLDVDEFNHSATQSSNVEAFQQTIQLYSGDLLPDCYDDWIQPEREKLRETYISALQRLILLLEDERTYSQAISYTQRLLQVEPLHEAAHYQLMRLYAATGERAKALHTYHSWATLLERELGVDPGLDIQIAYQRMVKADMQPSIQRFASIPSLIGRGAEWTILQSTWRNTTCSQARFVLVTGEAGVGKTRLVEEMINWSERQGIPVARANCFAAEGALAYAPVAEILRSRSLPALENLWLSEVARLLPEVLIEHQAVSIPTPLIENWQRLRLFKALGYALLTDRSELVLVIEDLQWTDQDTLEWVAYLLQAHAEIAPKTRLLVIGTLRAGELTDLHPLETLLADLRISDKVTEIELEPLNENETIALAGAITGKEIDLTWKAGLYHETEGNPLFIVEMVRAGKLQYPAMSPATGNGLATLKQSIPEKVLRIIEGRLAKLSQNAQDLAGFAAVIGREFGYRLLSLSSNLDEETLIRTLDELWQRRIIRERGEENYDFSHEKIRQVAYARLSDTRRRFCHRKAVEALEILYANDFDTISEQIAAHSEQAGLLEKAVFYYLLAAQAAQRIFANLQAIQSVNKGLHLLESQSASKATKDWIEEKRCQYLELLGDILTRIGDYDEAQWNHQQALRLVVGIDNIGKARLERKIGNDLREMFIYDQAVTAYQDADASFEFPLGENDQNGWWEWIELQLDMSLVYFYLSWQDNILKVVERLSSVIEQHGTIPQRGRYYRRLVTIKFRQNRFAADHETIELSRIALQTMIESGDLVEIASAYFGLGLALICHGDLDEAEEQIHAAIDSTKQTGQALLPVCLAYLSMVRRMKCDLEGALEYARRVLTITTLHKDPIYIAMAKSTFAWAAWRTQQLAEAEEQALQALDIWQGLPDAFPFRWLALWPLLGTTLTLDRLKEAFDASRALFETNQQLPSPVLVDILDSAYQAWGAGQSSETHSLLEQALELATNSGYL